MADLPAVVAFLDRRCGLPDAAVVAREKIFEPAPNYLKCNSFAAFDGESIAGLVATCGPWLRILAVGRDARGCGIGTSLLAWAESVIAGAGHPRSRTIAQPGNYLAPGLPEDDPETLAWFGRRGYTRDRRITNLLIDLRDNDRVTRARADDLAAAAAAAGYRVGRATPAQQGETVEFVGRAFSPTWAYEVDQAFGRSPVAVHIAVHAATGAIAAFAAHDGNNRGLGWFGPAGTAEDHRGRGLGAALLVPCLLDVAATGRDQGVIAWIGPRGFYERVVGVSGERHYQVLSKVLDPSEETP